MAKFSRSIYWSLGCFTDGLVRLLVWPLIVFSTSFMSFGQSPAAKETYNPAMAFQYLQQGKYSSALEYLQQHPSDDSSYWQELATIQSFVGDYQGALQSMDRLPIKSTDDNDPKFPELEHAEIRSAIDEIVRLAANRQIVILNEAHHIPLHRVFGLRLAERLKPLGFDFLAVETFNAFSMKALEENAVPDINTGFYTMEPCYGNFVRQALVLGYKPIAYEMIMPPPKDADPIDRINFRETAQVQNLVDQIFLDQPNAKVFIYVGYHHATEDTKTTDSGRETAWMAARLRKATGIDPLTIDQTEQTERSSINRASTAWRWVNEHHQPDDACVMAVDSESYWIGPEYRGRVDLQVFHPITRIEAGRAHWLTLNIAKQHVELPQEVPTPNDRYLIQARLITDPKNAIPTDQCLWIHGGDRPVLSLYEGEYRISVVDQKDQVVHESSVRVPTK